MRECIARAKTLMDLAKSNESAENGSKPLDLTTCSPNDVLIPFIPSMNRASQKCVFEHRRDP